MSNDISVLIDLAKKYVESHDIISSVYIGTAGEGKINRFVFISKGFSFNWDVNDSLADLETEMYELNKDLCPHCVSIPTSCEEDTKALFDSILLVWPS